MQFTKLHMLVLLLVLNTCVGAQLNEKGFDNTRGQEGIRTLYGYNRFKNKLPFAVTDSVVTFFLRGNKEAKQVFLGGSFSKWMPKAIPMKKTDSGWIALVKLAAGKHLYKFIIDGIWNIDDENLMREKDDQGDINSIYYKANATFMLPGFPMAKKVYLAASFNNWRETELSMNKATSSWEIPLYLSDGTYSYKFKADNEWLDDPKNNNRLANKSGGFSSIKSIGTPGIIKDLAYYQNEVAIHEQSGNTVKIIDALVNLGNGYVKIHDYPNATQGFQKAVILYGQLKNYSGMADILIKLADVYRQLSDFPHLLEYLQKANREYEKAGNENGLAKTFRSLGYYYLNLPHNPTAVNYFQQSLILYKQSDLQKEVANLLGDLGHSYLLMRDTVKALAHLQQALNLNQKIGNKPGMANNFWILGDYYFRISSNIVKALDCFQKSLSLFEETDNKVGIGQVLLNIAEVYNLAPDSALKNAGIPTAEKYTRSIENQKNGLQIMKDLLPESEQLTTLYILSQTYEKIGKFDSAHHYFKQYIALRDKVASTDKQKEITRLETKYEYEKKEDSLKLQQDLTDEKLQKQLLLARQQQQQIQLNQSQLALTNKEKDLQHLAYLKMQTDLENERLVKQQKEKENQLQSVQVKSLTQKNEIIQLSQQRQWVYIIGGFFLLSLGSVYFIYRGRLRSMRLETQLVKEKAAQEKKETEFQHKFADISMSVLRSQMNPHFIFNCLNSIKLYTMKNDTAAASAYLTKFSKLIRLVLENSRNERITLSSELVALELYIEMEAMRFKEKLSYSLVVDENVETDYIEIPPLLLQPYVENAIWHGLMPKEDGGHIDIKVAMKQEESLLEINITDNGIGREAATVLNKKIASKHRSYGMKATTERIALINQIYKTGANVFVHDLVNEQGQAAGTEVILQIPV